MIIIFPDLNNPGFELRNNFSGAIVCEIYILLSVFPTTTTTTQNCIVIQKTNK
jgi:hypothetical protein